jgi:hypothetical protein
MTLKTKITFGADPEFFVAHKDNPDKPVPACGLFGGAKKSPIFITPEGGYLEDGCTVEFNVEPKLSLVEVRKAIDRLITAFLVLNKDYVLYTHSSAQFTRRELRKHPQAMILGCDADYWAYGIRTKPQANQFKDMRFAGGHIHIGLDPWPKDLTLEDFAKALDLWVWWPTANTLALDYSRFTFYGHPGLYRETPYGIEYRTPDNSWAVPRPMSGTDSWGNEVSQWDSTVTKLVGAIEKRGAQHFKDFYNKLMDYYGVDHFMRNKNPAKLCTSKSTAMAMKERFDRYCSGTV